MKKTVSTSGASTRLLWASCISTSKSLIARRPRTMAWAPRARQKSTVRPSNDAISMASGEAPVVARASRMTRMRVSSDRSGVFRGLASTPTMTRSKTLAARPMTSRWPLVIGSNEPG